MSVLLLIYIFCLVLGGTFVGVSALGGFFDSDADLEADADFDVEIDADMDADFDLDADMDAEVEHGYDADIEVSVARRFNPFVSFKFYTFLLAFFGLTGVVFTGLGLWENPWGVLAVSLGMGLFAGLGIAYTMFRVNDSRGSEGITARDYVGLTGKVMLPVTGEKIGKVRLYIKGQIIEMPARSADDEVVFDFNQECFVLGIEDGVVQVVDSSRLLASSQSGLKGD